MYIKIENITHGYSNQGTFCGQSNSVPASLAALIIEYLNDYNEEQNLKRSIQSL
jgi:hypothetical protein